MTIEKITIVHFFPLENVLQLWCNTLKGGNPVEFTCVSFITMIMVNVSHVLCCFVVSWNKSFKRLGFCLLKVGIGLILDWPLSWQMKWDTSRFWPLSWQMKWDTSRFCKVPPFNVLHHNNYFMTSQHWWNIVSYKTQWSYLILILMISYKKRNPISL